MQRRPVGSFCEAHPPFYILDYSQILKSGRCHIKLCISGSSQEIRKVDNSVPNIRLPPSMGRAPSPQSPPGPCLVRKEQRTIKLGNLHSQPASISAVPQISGVVLGKLFSIL